MFQPQVHLRAARNRGAAHIVRTAHHVLHPGAGHDHHTVSGQPVPPAEVDVVACSRERMVEPAERIPYVAAHQHAGRVDRKDIAAAVVLPLVQFIDVDKGQALGPAARG